MPGMRKRWESKNDRSGAAGAVATIFVILIILAFINIYVVGYIEPQARLQQYNHMQQLLSQFSTLRVQEYLISSSAWKYPVSSPLSLGTPGLAPFSQPVDGQLGFQPYGSNISISYALGSPVFQPKGGLYFYENASGGPGSGGPGGPGGGGIGNHTTFLPSSTGKVYGSGNAGNWIWYVPEGKVAYLIVNGNYINQDDYDVFLGGNGGPALNNFTLITIMYGSHNIMDFTGVGNNLRVWYIVYGSDDVLSDQSNPCGFAFQGSNDQGYVQVYGTNDTGPTGWPAFQTIPQQLNLSGAMSLSVYNTNYPDQTIVYQAGAIFLLQDGRAVPVQKPQMSFTNTSHGAIINLGLISLSGSTFTDSGNGPVPVSQTLLSNRTITVGTINGINLINDLNVTINSPVASAWVSMLSIELSELQNVTLNPSVAKSGGGCVDMNNGPGGPPPGPPSPPGSTNQKTTHISWGAYSLIEYGDSVYLNIYNVYELTLSVGNILVQI